MSTKSRSSSNCFARATTLPSGSKTTDRPSKTSSSWPPGRKAVYEGVLGVNVHEEQVLLELLRTGDDAAVGVENDGPAVEDELILAPRSEGGVRGRPRGECPRRAGPPRTASHGRRRCRRGRKRRTGRRRRAHPGPPVGRRCTRASSG